MATISGLQSPNPYDAQAALRTRVPSRSAAHPQHPQVALSHAVSASSSYSPDWMQADNASQAASPDIYGAKGEPMRLSPANEPAKPVTR